MEDVRAEVKCPDTCACCPRPKPEKKIDDEERWLIETIGRLASAMLLIYSKMKVHDDIFTYEERDTMAMAAADVKKIHLAVTKRRSA